jgi:hypothetical protein
VNGSCDTPALQSSGGRRKCPAQSEKACEQVTFAGSRIDLSASHRRNTHVNSGFPLSRWPANRYLRIVKSGVLAGDFSSRTGDFEADGAEKRVCQLTKCT